MTFERASGIILHPTSLPSRFGIGDLGKSAYEFIDFLARSGQKIWQVLPLGPTGYEHSPYTMNFSAFAGNPLLISLDILAEKGLLNPDELIPLPSEEDPAYARVNFAEVIPHKGKYFQQAYDRFKQAIPPEYEIFSQQQSYWLDDYALFMALHEANPDKTWNQWEPGLARREPGAVKIATSLLHDSIEYHKFLQFQFFEQWTKVRRYCHGKNIKIIGDVSIYVCHHSAEVWSHPENFDLNPETLEPAWKAGVPPDYFSATGQLWGNPVYNWENLINTNFAWWIERFRATLQYVDVVRVDHFRGFEAFWRVPAGEDNAINGEWVKAPGYKLFSKLQEALGTLPILAEDLGIITPEVEAMRDRFEFPGMRILLFAFGGEADHPYLPHSYINNCIVYTGTHDNDTTVGWWLQAPQEVRQHVAKYLGYASDSDIHEISWSLMRLASASVADMAIFPLQDVLSLDNGARMNDPSVTPGNWRWRYTTSELLSQELSDRLLQITQLYNR
ncbi:MAG: 4-alpha-glucanotransferase [Okeania sp. SIO2C2]|uniref:4-alpha-glucanotransferase n=1 Tax=Okeania sp. SIO2C2 TaxID=2607787 RepID=UPI0013B6CE49|nr:4-alpha-glucanotransferase [Okeania sp. SIO2C2]NEP91082.1 4-alpha-glucanotransferase [Okeania sp. SIO2C2]